MSRSLRMALVYAGLCLLWSTSWLAIKIGLHGAPPLIGAGIRMVIGGVMLGAYRRARGGSLSVRAPARRYVAVIGLFLFAVPQSLLYLGETQTGSGLAAVLYGALPLYAALIAAQLLPDEPLTRVKLLGVALGIAGLAIVFGGSVRLNPAALAVLAMLGFVVAPSSQALAQVLLKRDPGAVSMLVLLAWATLGTGLLLLAAGLAFEPRHVSLDVRTLGSIAFLGAGSSFLGYGLYFWLLRRIGAVALSLIYQVMPLLALLWGWALYSEHLSLDVALGSLVVVSGMGLASGAVGR